MNPHEIAHQQAGLVDRSSRGTVQVTGADRTQFLQGLLTNDIKSPAPGRGCYAAWLLQGRMITDMCVFVLDERILLDVRPDADDWTATGTTGLFGRRRTLTKELTQMRVVGPDSPRALIVALGTPTTQPLPVTMEELNHWPEYQSATIPLDDTPAF